MLYLRPFLGKSFIIMRTVAGLPSGNLSLWSVRSTEKHLKVEPIFIDFYKHNRKMTTDRPTKSESEFILFHVVLTFVGLFNITSFKVSPMYSYME